MQLHIMTVNYICHWRLKPLSLSLQLINGQGLLYLLIMYAMKGTNNCYKTSSLEGRPIVAIQKYFIGVL
jgi:hypothetical protein